MRYTLNATEQRLAQFVVNQRIAYNQKTNATPTVYTNESLYSNNLHAYGAEIAFCKLFNVYPDTDFTVRHVSDAHVGGYSVDVKQTKRDHGKLYVKKMHRANGYPDYYAMMVGKFPTYEFRGFISSKVMVDESRVQHFHRNGMHSMSYVADQSELNMEIGD